MYLFLQQILSGIASGSLFATLGLAIVLIHRTTGILNFADETNNASCQIAAGSTQ